MFSVLLALAAAPPPLSAEQQQQVRCVALLAIVAGEQQRRPAAALELPPLARQGPRFAQAVGDALIRDSGRTQEQVRDLILAEVAAAQRRARPNAKLPVEEAQACLPVMETVAPPLPPPSAVQCAGLLKLAADDARRRGGLSKAATDLITLSAVLDNRARTELTAAGKSGAESDREIILAREAIAKVPQSAPDMEACMELAQP